MISTIISGAVEAVAKFQGYPSRIRADINRAVLRQSISLVAYIQSQKLEGQVLKSHTHNLARAINYEVTESGDEITGIVGVDRTAPYGKTQEEGFQGIVTVRDHLRTSVLGNQFNVRAHEVNMNLPARPFMRPSLTENEGTIRAAIQEALNEALA